MRKPTIKKGPAAHYAGPGETILEISNGVKENTRHKGGLIALRNAEDGTLKIHLYRLDKGVDVSHSYSHHGGELFTREDYGNLLDSVDVAIEARNEENRHTGDHDTRKSNWNAIGTLGILRNKILAVLESAKGGKVP